MAITMADPWKITYNDFGSNGTGSYTWKYLKIDEYRVDPLIDKDGITHYTTQHTLSGTALLVVSEGNLAAAIQGARDKLTKQGRNLVIKTNDVEIANCGNNTVGSNPTSTDSMAFPKCWFSISEIFGNQNAIISFTFQWQDVVEDVLVADGESFAFDVLSHQWRQRFNIAENGLQTWSVEGSIKVRADANGTGSPQLGNNPDLYRQLVMPLIPDGFRIKSMNWSTSASGEELVYSLTFQEHARRLPYPAKRGTGSFTYARSLDGTGFLGTKSFDAEFEGDAACNTEELLAALLTASQSRIMWTGAKKDLITAVEIREHDIFSKKRLSIHISARGIDPKISEIQGEGSGGGHELNFGILNDFIEKGQALSEATSPYGSKLIGSCKRALFQNYAGYTDSNFPIAGIVALSGSNVAQSSCTDSSVRIEETIYEHPDDVPVPQSGEAPIIPAGDEADHVLVDDDNKQQSYLTVHGSESVKVKTNFDVLPVFSELFKAIPWQTKQPEVYVESEYTISRNGSAPPSIQFKKPSNGVVLDESNTVDSGDLDSNNSRMFTRHHFRRVQLINGLSPDGYNGEMWHNGTYTITFDNGAWITVTYIYPNIQQVARPVDPRIDNLGSSGEISIFDTMPDAPENYYYPVSFSIPIGNP